jgi:tRNA(His) guanylyltransferase
MSKDALGSRMKEQYEQRVRYSLPRRTYTIMRIDGRAFHTYCKGLKRPFDTDLMADMDATAVALCTEIMGARFAYTQSDEISLLLTDFEKKDTEAWFGGNVQKMASVAASVATAAFNRARFSDRSMMAVFSAGDKWATFDARAFTIPDPWEVVNYFRWRYQDCVRNSISMTAHAYFPPSRLHGLSSDQQQELLFTEKGINWAAMPEGFKNGRLVHPVTVQGPVTFTRKDGTLGRVDDVERRTWVVDPAPNFQADALFDLIPHMPHPGDDTP